MHGSLTPTVTRQLLESLGLRPQKRLGQNFLIDSNIVRKSLELAQIASGDTVVEVGPGLGTLTGALLKSEARVWAVELDPVLAAHLRETLGRQWPDHFHLLEADAVSHPLAGFSAGPEGPYKVVANLPYAISTPWMDAVLENPLPRRLVLMLQREAADRFTAEPGTRSYGAITVFLTSAFRRLPGHRVSPRCFFPQPEVESSLVALERLDQPYRFTPAAKRLVRTCFQYRRKQLGSILRSHFPELRLTLLAELERAGLPALSRAEQVPVQVWQQLARLAAGAFSLEK